MIDAMASRFGTGSVPGMARGTPDRRWCSARRRTPLRQPQNIFVRVESSTWHSSPMTVSSSAMTRGSLSKSVRGASTSRHLSSEDARPAPIAAAEHAPPTGADLGRARRASTSSGAPRTWRSRVVNETLPTARSPPSIRFLVAGARPLRHRDPAGRPRSATGRPPTQWRAAAIVGVLLMVCGNGGVAWAETDGSERARGARDRARVPLWIAVIDRLVFHHRQPPRGDRAALVLGFAGAAILVGGSHRRARGPARAARRGRRVVLLGVRLPLPASGRAPPPAVRRRAAMQMLIAGVILIVLSGPSPASSAGSTRRRFSRASVLALAYLIVFGSWLGFTSYLWLLRNARTSLVSTYAYVTPVGRRLPRVADPRTSRSRARTVVAGAVISWSPSR